MNFLFCLSGISILMPSALHTNLLMTGSSNSGAWSARIFSGWYIWCNTYKFSTLSTRTCQKSVQLPTFFNSLYGNQWSRRSSSTVILTRWLTSGNLAVHCLYRHSVPQLHEFDHIHSLYPNTSWDWGSLNGRCRISDPLLFNKCSAVGISAPATFRSLYVTRLRRIPEGCRRNFCHSIASKIIW